MAVRHVEWMEKNHEEDATVQRQPALVEYALAIQSILKGGFVQLDFNDFTDDSV